ncbi:hypothetical protein CCACVL1_07922 [Corchorus capsularis]|uniref:Uncharacterized protein n=1 Tax=Corchorus capsularis TaxID=210143 RepID=A0A1R3J398_COCAP|nr:hypothetical protein CCACVL1_07922 [Corchorus capsularis]
MGNGEWGYMAATTTRSNILRTEFANPC